MKRVLTALARHVRIQAGELGFIVQITRLMRNNTQIQLNGMAMHSTRIESQCANWSKGNQARAVMGGVQSIGVSFEMMFFHSVAKVVHLATNVVGCSCTVLNVDSLPSICWPEQKSCTSLACHDLGSQSFFPTSLRTEA